MKIFKTILFFATLLILSSCYTKKNGDHEEPQPENLEFWVDFSKNSEAVSWDLNADTRVANSYFKVKGKKTLNYTGSGPFRGTSWFYFQIEVPQKAKSMTVNLPEFNFSETSDGNAPNFFTYLIYDKPIGTFEELNKARGKPMAFKEWGTGPAKGGTAERIPRTNLEITDVKDYQGKMLFMVYRIADSWSGKNNASHSFTTTAPMVKFKLEGKKSKN